MTSTELCTAINTYLLDNNCKNLDFIFSTYVTDADKEVISKVILKYLSDTLASSITESSLENESVLSCILQTCTDDVKMQYLCNVVQDATKALEESKSSLLYTNDITSLSDAREGVFFKNLDPNVVFKFVCIFGICIILAIFTYIFCVTFFSSFIKSESVRFVDQTLGNFNAILQTVIVYLFNMGSSQFGRTKMALPKYTPDEVKPSASQAKSSDCPPSTFDR